MKFLPPLSSLALLGLAISLSACSTPSNRRELYNQLGGNGPWHDYSRRLDAAEKTGVSPADMGHVAGGDLGPAPAAPGGPGDTTVVRGSRPTRQPKSAPLDPDPTALPSSQPPPAAPPTPANVPVPSSPTTPDSAIPAAPGGATTAPASDPASVPTNPPTT